MHRVLDALEPAPAQGATRLLLGPPQRTAQAKLVEAGQQVGHVIPAMTTEHAGTAQRPVHGCRALQRCHQLQETARPRSLALPGLVAEMPQYPSRKPVGSVAVPFCAPHCHGAGLWPWQLPEPHDPHGDASPYSSAGGPTAQPDRILAQPSKPRRHAGQECRHEPGWAGPCRHLDVTGEGCAVTLPAVTLHCPRSPGPQSWSPHFWAMIPQSLQPFL